MDHLEHLKNGLKDSAARELMLTKATGRFYTHEVIGRELVAGVWRAITRRLGRACAVRVVDPFAGDGRLLLWLLQRAAAAGRTDIQWAVSLWDVDEPALEEARRSLETYASNAQIQLSCETVLDDSFKHALGCDSSFHIVVTNPPWERLKPDRRELEALRSADRTAYIDALRAYDQFLERNYPASQPQRKFAGWGTNLSRAGLELAVRITAPKGVTGIVSQSSFVADELSMGLRRWVLRSTMVREVASFPAEARLFDGADVGAVTLVLDRQVPKRIRPTFVTFDSASTRSGFRTRATHWMNLLAIPIAIEIRASSAAGRSRAR